MERVSPRSSFVAGDWMDRFEQLAKNPELVLPPNQSRINTTKNARLVAGVAAVVFSVAGLIQNRGSFYLMGVVCAVGAFIFHGLNLRAQLIQRTRQLAPPPNLDGIADGIKALTEYKIERCTKAFHGINVRNCSNPQALFSKALDQWSADFNGDRTDFTELYQIESLLEAAYSVDQEEVQNYRRILPSVARLIAQDLTTSKNTQLVEIWYAACRFATGFDFDENGEMQPGYINLTINASHVIEAQAWQPII